jgi:NADPH-dependent glutamate synthase beta subunit-like oxidoreductase
MVGSDDRKAPSRVNTQTNGSVCPLGQNVKEILFAVTKKDNKVAIRICEANALPSICGRVCSAPCTGGKTKGVSIKTLKQLAPAAAGKAKAKKIADKASTVAVVGSGPAGLAAAHQLVKLGIKPVIFEATDRAGGMLADVIPDSDLPGEILAGDIANLEKMGVDIRLGKKAGENITWDDLEKDFDAVLVATGAQKGVVPSIPGAELKGVTNAVDFCRDAREDGASVMGSVVVQGGGLTSLQVARVAKKLGAEEVSVVHPYPIHLWPATSWAIEAAEKAGVVLLPDCRITEIWGSGVVEQVLVRPITYAREDVVGRVAGGDYGTPRRLKASCFVATTNRTQVSVPNLENIASGLFGNLKVDSGYKTDRPRWYAAGEAVTGPDGILDSMLTGKLAAQAIKNDLEAK